MAPRRRDQNPSGLGRAIINRKVKDAQRQQESGLYTTDIPSSARLKSVTHEKDLDEFLNNAELAGTEFTAERRNVRVIQQTTTPHQNPYLLTRQEEEKALQKQQENKKRLRVPRRPAWTKSMTAVQLEKQEKAAFLEWRRGLAELQDHDKFLLTPFERNLEVWRQLWRVLERSHLLVQIVDARNPLRFRCEDLEEYVVDIEGNEGEAGTGKGKRCSLLLINKADLLTREQREQWADYFDQQKITFAFFSAAVATALQSGTTVPTADEELTSDSESESSGEDIEKEEADVAETSISGVELEIEKQDILKSNHRNPSLQPALGGRVSENTLSRLTDDTDTEEDPRTKILTVPELEGLFLRTAPDLSIFADGGTRPEKLVVGLVGYPNVGKSSTINSLLGEKKVSVSSTPGKTKHFQTIHLSERIILCDCPGLVFPQFATTKADLVCDGVLPIDQMREHTGPVTLLVERIPKEVLEATYGLALHAKSPEEGGNGKITAENMLMAHAIARGYMRSGQGNPDEARSARYILKDYVNAKLLYCHPPPGVLNVAFNEKTHQKAIARVAHKKRAPTTRVGKDADTFVPVGQSSAGTPVILGQGVKSQVIDRDFFANGTMSNRPFVQSARGAGQEFTRPKLYPHQNMVADDGNPIGLHHARLASVVANVGSGEKQHKRNKRTKQRSGRGYD